MTIKLITLILVSIYACGGNVTGAAVSDDQVEPSLYKVRSDHSAPNQDAGPVQASKASGEKELQRRLRQQRAVKDHEIEMLRGKMAAMTDSLNVEKQRAGTLEMQVPQQEQELKAQPSQGQVPDQVSRELVMTRSNLDQAKQKIIDLERQLATSNLEYAKQRIAELDRQLDAKDKEVRVMRTDSESWEKLKEDLALRTEELKRANQHNLALEHEHIRAKEALDKVTRRLTDLETQISARSDELERTKRVLAGLQQSETKKQEVSLSQGPASAEKDLPHSAVCASGQPVIRTEQPSLMQSGEPEASGSDLTRLRKDLASQLRLELSGGSVSLWQMGNKVSLELAADELFASGQAVVTRRGSSVLRRIGTVLKKFHYQTVEVVGHTDNTPAQKSLGESTQDNGRLSKARAQQASRSLISGGLQADRVTTVGYAGTSPIVTGSGEGAQSRNRRVEIIITQWSEPDDVSGDTATRVSKKQRMFSTQKVAHR
jgi:flagellar motor protein MotB